MRIPDPDGTTRNCPYGCGVMTVLADFGTGRMQRVHCGTYRTPCPARQRAPEMRQKGCR